MHSVAITCTTKGEDKVNLEPEKLNNGTKTTNDMRRIGRFLRDTVAGAAGGGLSFAFTGDITIAIIAGGAVFLLAIGIDFKYIEKLVNLLKKLIK